MNFEDITNLIKTVLLILSLPVTFIQLRKTSFDKAQSLVDEVSRIVLFRLHSNHYISREEIKAIINSKALSAKISNRLVLLDDVLDGVTDKIEDVPFFSRKNRRKVLENIRILREGKYSTHLRISQFVKNYEKQIIFTALSLTIALLLLFPNQFKVTNSDLVERHFFIQLGIGILIIIFTILIFFIFNKLIYPKIDWGVVKIQTSTFHLLPNFYNEKLFFSSSTNKLKFKLVDASFKENKQLVETNPGCLFFGIAKYYKKLQIYIVKFSNTDRKIDIQIELCSKSFVNGFYDIDFIIYKIFENNEIKGCFEIPLLNEEIKDSSFYSSLENLIKKLIINEDNRILTLQSDTWIILVDKQFRLIGINIQNEVFLLD
jgi:hypothetical protein